MKVAGNSLDGALLLKVMGMYYDRLYDYPDISDYRDIIRLIKIRMIGSYICQISVYYR